MNQPATISPTLEDTRGLTTLRDLIRWAASRFDEYELFLGHGTTSYLDEAAWLVLETLRMPVDLHDSWWSANLTPTEIEQVIALIRERCLTRKPTAYLLNQAWFAGRPYYVDERVLIPRSPFAELINQRFEPWLDPEQIHRALDLGTGSGCMAIALAHAFPNAEIVGSDLYTDALAVAAINVERHQVGEQVQLIQSDLFDNLQGEVFDLIISNPPYVAPEEAEDMPTEFKYEPPHALYAPKRGLALVDQILRDAPNHLSDNGWLFVEVGNSRHWMNKVFGDDNPFQWVMLSQGGDGIFALPAYELRAWNARRAPAQG